MLASKRSSFIFLSLLCVALADLRDGLGPFFGVYPQDEGWKPDETCAPCQFAASLRVSGTQP